MSYPPSVPPNTRTDATPLPTNMPSDINTISNALTDIINELGDDPSGSFASATARFDYLATQLFTVTLLQFVSAGPAGVFTAQTVAHGLGTTLPGKIVSIQALAKNGTTAVGALMLTVNQVDGTYVYLDAPGTTWTHIYIVRSNAVSVAFP